MDDLLLRDIGELRRRLAPHLTRARKVIAFGSVARGDADAGSDLDLIVVADTTRPFFERHKDFPGLYDVWPRLDRPEAEARAFIRTARGAVRP